MTESIKAVKEACCICFSPSVTTSQLGVKACKQCAAFFRRTVSMNQQHKCIGHGKCAVHFGRTVICKRCRYEKCLKNKMKYYPVTTSNSSIATHPEETHLEPLLGSTKDDLPKTIAHYTKMGSDLNIRRKLLHTSPALNDVFVSECETPYNINNVKEFTSNPTNLRTDVACLIDYIKGFSDFEKFTTEEKGLWYRYTALLDYILNGANYSVRIGIEKEMFVLIYGHYIKINPPPLSVEEAKKAGKFISKVEENYYRTIQPAVIKQWGTIVLPLAKLNLSFKEFALFKALISWQVGSTKFTPETRRVCDYNKNVLFEALLSVNSKPNISPEERLGELLLFMGSILEILYGQLDDVVMISTFNLMDHDPLVSEICDHRKWQ